MSNVIQGRAPDGTNQDFKVDSFGNIGTGSVDAVASGIISTQNLVPLGAATANSAVEISCSGLSTVTIQTVGTYTGALSPQFTVDGTTWITVTSLALLKTDGVYSATIPTAIQGIFAIDVSGYKKFRMTALAAVTGSVTLTLNGSTSTGLLGIDNPLPAGTNSIGAVTATMTSTTLSAPAAAITGVTIAKVLSAATSNSTLVLTGVRRVVGWNLFNTTITYKYFRFYNKATAPTVGTDSPLFVIGIPPNNRSEASGALPIPFTLGLGYGITGASPDLDNTSTAVGDVVGVIFYV